jgi:hypothetical protein
MPTDVLTLGGVTFQNYDYSPPDEIPFGGEQAMKIHDLPGGARVIDILGPREADISFKGFIFADSAFATAQALDAMRASGQVVALTFGGTFRSVVVKTFQGVIHRFPNWVGYSITCTVASNPSLGNLGSVTSSIDSLIGADLGLAALAGGF